MRVMRESLIKPCENVASLGAQCFTPCNKDTLRFDTLIHDFSKLAVFLCLCNNGGF